MDNSITVNYEFTDNIAIAKKVLSKLPNPIACDFEVAPKYSTKDKDLLKIRYDNKPSNDKLQKIESNGLSHPSLTVITHLSIAWSDRDAFVIVCSSNSVRKFVYSFLTGTTLHQLWHNCIFDFKHIFYNTGTLPINYTDTQLLAKCLLNNANSFLDRVGLKELMNHAYGQWAISKDDFIIDEMWKKETILYSATDACATYKLYNDIQEEYNKWTLM